MNVRLAGLVLGGVVLLTVLGAVLLNVQRTSGRRGLLLQARRLHQTGEDGLAYAYLKASIDQDPRDIEVLELAGEILGAPGGSEDDWLRAVWMYEQILRSDGDPASENSQHARRELLRLHLRLGPVLPRKRTRYQTARVLAGQLLAYGADDVESLRLAAAVMRRMADQGNRAELDEARKLLERVHKKKPEDIPSALVLAALYRDELEDIGRASRLMDVLLERNQSTEAHLACSEFLRDTARACALQGRAEESRGLLARARREVERAVEMEPRSYSVRVLAAESAIQDGDYAGAREHLESLSEGQRRGSKARLLLGLCELREARIDSAVEIWRRGLLMSEGTDIGLTWWLAYVELQRDHLAEGRELAEQYRRLAGGEETPPGYRFLRAVEVLARNRPSEAASLLRKAVSGAGSELRAQIQLTLARCYQRMRDEASARAAYEEAVRLDPRLVEARIGLAKTVQGQDPARARHGLRQAVNTVGDDPALLAELGRLRIAQELRKPPAERSWTEVEELVERAVKTAPDDPSTVVFQARVLALEGEAEKSLKLLKDAVGRDPARAVYWEKYAEGLVEAGRIDEAVSVLQEATSRGLSSEQVSLRILDARLLDALGRTNEARRVLVQDIERLPGDDRAALWLALGDLYLVQGDPANALKAVKRGSQLLPDDPVPLLHLLDLGLDERSGGSEERGRAVREALKGLARISGESGPYYWLGQALVLVEDAARQSGEARERTLEQARELVGRARSRVPDERYPYILEGRIQRLLGRPEEAVSAYERALGCEGGEIVEPQLLALYEELGRREDLARLQKRRGRRPPSLERFAAESYLREGESEKAVEVAASVVKRAPGDLGLRVWQAHLLKEAGKPDEGEKTLREMVRARPEQIGPRAALLSFLAGEGKREEARELVESVPKELKGLSRPEFVVAQCWAVAGEDEKAAEAFETAVGLWPDDSRVRIEAMKFFDSRGRTEKAEGVVRSFLEKHPDQRWASRALALLRSGRRGDREAWREAWSLCQPEAGREDEPDDLLTRAVVLSRAPGGGRADEAAALLEEFLPMVPSDLPTASQARRLLISIDLKRDRPEQAARVAKVEAAQQASPETIRLYVEALIRSGSLSEADRQLSQLEEGQGGEPADVLLRARLLVARKHPEQAAKLLQERVPGWLEGGSVSSRTRGHVREAVSMLVGLNRLGEAEGLARALAGRSPGDVGLVGAVLARENRLDEAVLMLLGSVPTADAGLMPEIVHNLVSVVRRRPGDLKGLDRVIEGVKRAIGRLPSDPGLRVSLAGLYHLKGDYALEAAAYREALALNPKDRGFLNNLAWVLSEELGQPEEGLKSVDQAIAESSRPRPEMLDTRGVIYLRMGRIEEAVRDLERASEALPAASVFAHLAHAYYQAGSLDQFRNARDRAVAAGLTPEMLQPSERRELGPLLFDGRGAR